MSELCNTSLHNCLGVSTSALAAPQFCGPPFLDRRRSSCLGDVLCPVPVSFRRAVRNSAHAISMICGGARGPTIPGVAVKSCCTGHNMSAIGANVSAIPGKTRPRVASGKVRPLQVCPCHRAK